MSQLVTGEAVVLDLRTAGVPSRILASVIDLFVQGVALFALLILVGAVASSGSAATTAGLMILVSVVVLLGYPVALETLMGGRTLGKLALGLRVVRDDGGPIRFRHAITRGLLGLFVEKPGVTWAPPRCSAPCSTSRESGSATCWLAPSSCRSVLPPPAPTWPSCHPRSRAGRARSTSRG